MKFSTRSIRVNDVCLTVCEIPFFIIAKLYQIEINILRQIKCHYYYFTIFLLVVKTRLQTIKHIEGEKVFKGITDCFV